MREIVLDTETTGLSVADGERVIEIGCVEIVNRVRSGKYYHAYLNAPKESSRGALAVHGLTKEFLSDKPKFEEAVDEFLEFLGDSPLVIHNAKFDMGFLNNELELINKPALSNIVVDSLDVARKKFPGSKNSLDALCKRFNIDSSKRVKHGALLDSELLADVYLELTGGSQITFDLQKQEKAAVENVVETDFTSRDFELTQEEVDAHKEMVSKIKDSLWSKLS